MLPAVTIIGNTTNGAELRFTASGKAVATVTVVANKRARNQAGEWEDVGRSPFLRCTFWDGDAEAVCDAVTAPGTKVIVSGQLKEREYEDSEGNKRTSVELDFPTLGVVPRATQGNGNGGGQRPTQGRPKADPWAQAPAQADPWAAPQTDEPPF